MDGRVRQFAHHYDVPQAAALSRLQDFFSAGVVQVDPVGAAEALGREDMRALSPA
jgi:hypothetical protein